MSLMHRLNLVGIVAVVLSVITLGNYLWLNRSSTPDRPADQFVASLKQQRDEVSRMLNAAMRDLAITRCGMLDTSARLRKSAPVVSGDCKMSTYNNSGNNTLDKTLATALSIFFESKSVAGFGDGSGTYKRFLDSTHRLRVFDAYDSDPFEPARSSGTVKFLDLRTPQYGLPIYNWVMVFEAREHMSSTYESIYVDNIVRHAGSGIVLSWTGPRQEDLSHVNNKSPDYMKNILAGNGFEMNMDKSAALQKAASLPGQKVLVFYRRDGDSTSLLYA